MKERLSKSDVAKIAELLALGKSTSEVADSLSVSQATIYNQKAKLIREGLKLPEGRRGRKPNKQITERAASEEIRVIKPKKGFEEYRFLINSIAVRVSGNAKDIFISPTEMRVKF
jgi:transposase